MNTVFIYLVLNKIPKPIVARIIVLSNLRRYAMISVKRNIMWMLRFAIKNGLDVVEHSDLICLASEKGYLEIVRYLHENGADIRAQDDYPICWASANGYLDVVKYLHQNGADLRSRSDCCARWAAKYNQYNIISYIYDYHPEIIANVICVAAYEGNLSMIKHVYENYNGFNGDSALCIAVNRNHFEVVKFLHENGANIRAYGDYAISEATILKHTKIIDYIKQFI